MTSLSIFDHMSCAFHETFLFKSSIINFMHATLSFNSQSLCLCWYLIESYSCVLGTSSLSYTSFISIGITKLSITSVRVSAFSLFCILKHAAWWIRLYEFYTIIYLRCTFPNAQRRAYHCLGNFKGELRSISIHLQSADGIVSRNFLA